VKIYINLMIIVLTGALLVMAQPTKANIIDATFELKLAAEENDFEIAVGERLNLDLWLTLSGDSPSYDAQIISFFLNVDDNDNNIISFNGDFVNDTVLPMTEMNLPADNTPVTGEFSRSLLSFISPTAIFQNNVAKRIGHFSVTGIAEGMANYSFYDDDMFREWLVDIAGPGETINLYPTPGSSVATITVLPEPEAYVLILAAFSLWSMRRRP